MDRRLFLNRIARWTALVILAGISLLLRHKIVPGRNCSSCPEYTLCSGPENCLSEADNS